MTTAILIILVWKFTSHGTNVGGRIWRIDFSSHFTATSEDCTLTFCLPQCNTNNLTCKLSSSFATCTGKAILDCNAVVNSHSGEGEGGSPYKSGTTFTTNNA